MMVIQALRNLLACLILLHSVCLCACEGHHEDWVRETHRLRDEAAQRIATNLKVQCALTGGGLMGGLNSVSLGFNTDAEWTRDQARRNILIAIDTLLASLNSSEEVRAHSVANPIESSQIDISIIYSLPTNEGACPRAVVDSSFEGEIVYKCLRVDGGRQEILHRETVEEARELLRHQTHGT